MSKMRKFAKRAYIFAVVTAGFIATVAPAFIQAADITPSTLPALQGFPLIALTAKTSGTTVIAAMAQAAVRQEPASILYLRITAYSSTADQTDSTPFIMADGNYVRDGVAATNFLPFGTKIKIPSLFGNKIFTIEDRMAKRLTDVIDIWMPTRNAALRFGVNYANVVIVDGPQKTITER